MNDLGLTTLEDFTDDIGASSTINELNFDLLYEKYYPRVYGYAYKLTGNHQDSLDVVQEAFIKIYKNIHNYNPEKNISSWILKITHNTAVNFIKRQRDNRVINSSDKPGDALALDLVPTIRLNPEEKLSLERLGERVKQACEHLTDRQKNIIQLRYLEEWDIHEIAKYLNLSLDTVRVHLHRALIGLRQVLNKKL